MKTIGSSITISKPIRNKHIKQIIIEIGKQYWWKQFDIIKSNWWFHPQAFQMLICVCFDGGKITFICNVLQVLSIYSEYEYTNIRFIEDITFGSINNIQSHKINVKLIMLVLLELIRNLIDMCTKKIIHSLKNIFIFWNWKK